MDCGASSPASVPLTTHQAAPGIRVDTTYRTVQTSSSDLAPVQVVAPNVPPPSSDAQTSMSDLVAAAASPSVPVIQRVDEAHTRAAAPSGNAIQEDAPHQPVAKILKPDDSLNNEDIWVKVDETSMKGSPTRNADNLVTKRSGWKTVQIFVSSTFKDFHHEREILVKEVS